MSVVDLTQVEDPGLPEDYDGRTVAGYFRRRRHRLARAAQAEQGERDKKAAAWVEAAVVQAVETPYDDPEFEKALRIVAHSVKSMLSPTALGYLEGTLSSDERAGSVRWRELARLDLWLARAALPVGRNARRLVRQTGFTESNAARLTSAGLHPHRLFPVTGRAPGRTVAAIYGIARRARVSPSTVVAALLVYGLERLTQAIRQSKEIPSALTAEQAALFPEAE